MKEFPITGGVALVDDDDFDWLVDTGPWSMSSSRANGGGGYAIQGGSGLIMHRLILGNPPGQRVDHRNGNRLDNRRANLRIATVAGHSRNRGPNRRPTSSRFKGVCWDAQHSKWRATITVDNRHRHLGLFREEADAAVAYNAAADAMFGEFARPNEGV